MEISNVIIERSEELDRLIQILCRKNKNNPLLVGEPGIGKFTLVESLAARIVNKNVPDNLKDVTLLKLDCIDLVIGFDLNITVEFIAKLTLFLRIILVIDNIEQLFATSDGRENSNLGGGLNFNSDSAKAKGDQSSSTLIIAAILKGTVQCIGITNPTSYTKYLENNTLWNRRFQFLRVNEPDISMVFEIVKLISLVYSAYHGVNYTPKSLIKAINLSTKYLTTQFFPEKVIDVLDEAGAKVNFDREKNYSALKEEDSKLLRDCIRSKVNAIFRQDYAVALAQYQRETELVVRIVFRIKTKDFATFEVTEEHIAAVVSRRIGVPLTQLTQDVIEKLKNLDTALKRGVVGQDEAVNAVTCAIRRARVGFKSPNRPIASFIFAGPTGVGKTELTKLLASEYFGTDEALLRFDMSEYKEKHSIAKLIGSPPGYIGFEQGGILTDGVRRRPYTVVLFDEIEKGNKAIFDLLLQILDDGRLSDNTGRVINFTNTLIILTSNLGANLANIKNAQGGSLEYNTIRKKVINKVKAEFRPEFLNRLDEIVVFKPLRKPEIAKIADILINDLVERAKSQDIILIVTDRLKQKIIDQGYDPLYGARPLRRALASLIEDPLTNAFLAGIIKPGLITVADLNDDGSTRIFSLDDPNALSQTINS